MKARNLRFRTDKKPLIVALVTFLLISILMGAACFQYYLRLQKTVEEESGSYLQEISKLLGDNAGRIIDDNFSVLSTTAMALKYSDADSFEEIESMSMEQQEYWKYDNLYLVDEKGVAYDSRGNSTTLGNETFLSDVIIKETPSMSSTVVVGGKDSVIFAIPAQGLKIGSLEFSAIAASYDLSTFDQILSMTAFGGEAYAHIIQRDGSVVVRSSSNNAPQTGYNVLNSLLEAEMGADSDFEMLQQDIAAGNSGMATYTLDGVRTYMAYTPINEQEWSLLTFVPVSVVNAKSEMLLHITLLLCGFITLAFGTLLIFLASSFYRHKRSLEQIAYVDPITHGNTIQKFYIDAQDLLQKSVGGLSYSMIYMNIEKFKVLNEQYGRTACDEILRSIQHGISSDLASDECMGRVSADHFCILSHFKTEEALAERLSKWRNNAVKYIMDKGSVWLPQNAEFGVYIIENVDLPLTHMIDRAKLSLAETTHVLHDKMSYAFYNEKMRSILLREKHLEDIMEASLKNCEFEVFLQPKYQTKAEHIGGAEALVRWRSATEGMIYPDEFIPLFEKNGFVVQIDLFVFEETCRMLERWTKGGLPPIKISVNCSRIHLRIPNFLDNYRRIVEKYVLPPNVLEIELTETAVFEDVASLVKVIHEIHAMGLSCSMDDFGSGYSSLNLIRDIPVDTLKLDRIFFRTSAEDAERTESVVATIINMAKALHMRTVAEGVEEREQVEMLKRLDCDYIQGYYFAKPMPIPQFEQLLLQDVMVSKNI